MSTKRAYLRCDLHGRGKLLDGSKKVVAEFEVLNISASGASIGTDADLDEGGVFNAKMLFNGHITEMNLNVNARLVRKEAYNNKFVYGIEFVDITDRDRTEIDEIVCYSCI